jgi:hypothetical protein
MADSPDVNEAVRRIEALLGELSDPQVRPKAEELVRVLMEIYGAGLERILAIVEESGSEALAQDKLVASLLLIHGLHPVEVETRIREALAAIERCLTGQHLVFEGIEGGIARVRIESNGGGGVPPGLPAAVERAVSEAAPDLDGVKVDVPAKLVQIGLAPGS